jgi:hypothetical protein
MTCTNDFYRVANVKQISIHHLERKHPFNPHASGLGMKHLSITTGANEA